MASASPRRRSLLEFAIAASIAVLPVLLVVLLAVGTLRPSDAPDRPDAQSNRYVSVRQVAALQTFEHAIVRRSQITDGAPSADAVLAGVPACRDAWGPPASALDTLRERLGLAGRPAEVSPAQRIAARLAELDRALERFSTRENRRVEVAVGLDARRWFAAASQALQAPVRAPEYPDKQFRLDCSDLAAAVAALMRSGARMLDTLSWRGTEVAANVASWRADQMVQVSARQLARANPWGGLPGCIYLGSAEPPASGPASSPAATAPNTAFVPTYAFSTARGSAQQLCADPVMAGTAAAGEQAKRPVTLAAEPDADLPGDDPHWSVPPSLAAMLRPLDTLRWPSGALYRAYTESPTDSPNGPSEYRFGPNRITLDGSVVDVGFSVDLTIDPALQALAQKTAACYTGYQQACRALGIARKEDVRQPIGHKLLERAVVRMAAVAIVDVATGRIDALAGALSPCTRQEYDGPGRGRGCDGRLPYATQYQPDALLNPAVFHDAMPASIIKPVMATAFLSDPLVGGRWLTTERNGMRAPTPPPGSLRAELMRSDSNAFLDRMFCAERNFMDCERPWRIQAASALFGWNPGCAQARQDCGKRDLLFGRAVDAVAESGLVQPLGLPVPYGRLLAEPDATGVGTSFRLMSRTPLDPLALRRCAIGADARRPSQDDWEKCRAPTVVDVVAEGWGQGNARSSALGGAGMMVTLAAAANGQPEVRAPHLVRALRGAAAGDGVALTPAVMRWSLAEPSPNQVPRESAELILSGLSFTHRAGTARPACEQVFDPAACGRIDWIAGKTGTPTFPNDGRSLDELARLCGSGARAAERDVACGPLRPYKWYVAAWRPPGGDGRWTKAIGVLTERNWVAQNGRIHGAGDTGPNPAAEIALQIAARHLNVLPRSAP